MNEKKQQNMRDSAQTRDNVPSGVSLAALIDTSFRSRSSNDLPLVGAFRPCQSCPLPPSGSAITDRACCLSPPEKKLGKEQAHPKRSPHPGWWGPSPLRRWIAKYKGRLQNRNWFFNKPANLRTNKGAKRVRSCQGSQRCHALQVFTDPPLEVGKIQSGERVSVVNCSASDQPVEVAGHPPAPPHITHRAFRTMGSLQDIQGGGAQPIRTARSAESLIELQIPRASSGGSVISTNTAAVELDSGLAVLGFKKLSLTTEPDIAAHAVLDPRRKAGLDLDVDVSFNGRMDFVSGDNVMNRNTLVLGTRPVSSAETVDNLLPGVESGRSERDLSSDVGIARVVVGGETMYMTSGSGSYVAREEEGRPSNDNAIGNEVQRPPLAGHARAESGLLHSPFTDHPSTSSLEVDPYGFILHSCLPGIAPASSRKRTRERKLEQKMLAKWKTLLGPFGSNFESIRAMVPHTVKRFVRKGIPGELRGLAWLILSGGKELLENNPGQFESLLKQSCDMEPIIKRDLHRTFPNHYHFQQENGPGQRALFNVLKAYAVYDAEVGYVQGMGSIVAVLLLYMTEEQAFWTFTALLSQPRSDPCRGSRRVSPPTHEQDSRELFTPELPLCQTLISQFDFLLRKKYPKLARHMKAEGVEVSMYATKWWMTLFTFSLPFPHVIRAWDIFMLEGWKMGLRVGLAIMKTLEKSLVGQPFDELVERITPEYLAEEVKPADDFVKMALRIRVSRGLREWSKEN